MASYKCRYMTESKKIVEETFEASGRSEVVSIIRDKGASIIRIEEAKKFNTNITFGKTHINKKQVTLFCRQMSTMLTAGIPMVKCFDVLSSQSDNKVFKALMASLTNDVMAGNSLSSAMEKYPDDFPEMLTEMVKIGEVTGDLNAVLLRMAEQYERDAKITQKIKGALTYPIVVALVAVAACIFMLIKVVPQFVDVFDSLDSELPALTKGLLSVSDFITKKWYLLLILIPIIVILLIRFFKIRKVKYVVDKIKLTMPGLKVPMQKIASARFARTLYTLISSGVPIIQALEYSKHNVMNLYMEEYIDKIETGIRQGKNVSGQMAEMPVFPKLLVSMLSVGENSGDMEGMLSKSAEYFESETASSVEQLTTIIEPIMIVVVGLLIGMIVLALYSPMFEAITAMQNSI